jgi:hypothetical protein
MASMSSAKGSSGLLMLGAAVLVGGQVLFAVILGEFNYGATNVAVALIILLSILGSGSWAFGTGTQRILGYFLGLAGAVDLLNDIRFGFPDGAVDNIANFAFYVGCLLAFLGARGIKAS